MIRAIVVDDEPLARRGMRTMLSGFDGIRLVGEYPDGVRAVEAIREEKPDLVFLDIQMPEMDGFDVIEQVGPGRMPAVIFVTAYDEHAVRAFRVQAVDYLLKPVNPDHLSDAVARARAHLTGRKTGGDVEKLVDLLTLVRGSGGYLTRFMVKASGRISFVAVTEIHWIEAQGDYVCLHTHGKKHLVREKIGELERRLDPSQFSRIHRSTIVRFDSIGELHPLFSGEYAVMLKTGEKLTLSRTFRDRFMKALRTSG